MPLALLRPLSRSPHVDGVSDGFRGKRWIHPDVAQCHRTVQQRPQRNLCGFNHVGLFGGAQCLDQPMQLSLGCGWSAGQRAPPFSATPA